ncbi:MAG TPA: glycogen synthase GlgA [Kofleriaceae bacterium]|nr:glycogen synthase GlgA [Kofleriaceae bacterium]
MTSEVAPYAQSGGLADVAAGLPAAQAGITDVDAAVLCPYYKTVAAKLATAGITAQPHADALTIQVGPHTFHGSLRVAHVGNVKYGFLDVPPLYDRDGTLYGPGGTGEFDDNHVRFGVLGKAARLASAILLGGDPDVLHVHDWQGGPAAVYARAEQWPCAIVITVHNLAYRGIFPKWAMAALDLPWSMFTPKLLEFYDQVSFLKGGMAVADAVTTVSPSYAQEILTPERGEALDGFLRWDVKRLVGIVNGIDTGAWDPSADRALPASFSANDVAGKAVCRTTLAEEAKLPDPPEDEPLLGVIARMTDQKGLDLVADLAPELAHLGARLVVLGAGEPALEDRFRYLARTFSHHVAVRIGFDAGYARRIYAGTDFFVMPSRFEPCGLGQLYAMRYGSVPVVTPVGGLRDTVSDPQTGIKLHSVSGAALLDGVARAVALYRDRVAFASRQRAAMMRDSSWLASANEYVALYRSLRA